MKCLCNHCSTPLEFDDEHEGATIECPSCGSNTLLYAAPQRKERKPLRALLLPFIALLLVGVAIYWVENQPAADAPQMLHQKLIAVGFQDLDIKPLTRQALQVGAMKEAGLFPELNRLTVPSLSAGVIDVPGVDVVRSDHDILKSLSPKLFPDEHLEEDLDGLAMDAMALDAVIEDFPAINTTEWSTLSDLGYLAPDTVPQAHKVSYEALINLKQIFGAPLIPEVIAMKIISESKELSAVKGKEYFIDLDAVVFDEVDLGRLKASPEVLRMRCIDALGALEGLDHVDVTDRNARKEFVKSAERRLKLAVSMGSIPAMYVGESE